MTQYNSPSTAPRLSTAPPAAAIVLVVLVVLVSFVISFVILWTPAGGPRRRACRIGRILGEKGEERALRARKVELPEHLVLAWAERARREERKVLSLGVERR